MANIADDTNLIRTATYGKDMREAIADGIEDINAEVESTTARQANVEGRQDDVEETFQEVINLGGNPSAEVVQARTDTINNITYDNLQARMDGVSTQLADKVNKGHTDYNGASASEPMVELAAIGAGAIFHILCGETMTAPYAIGVGVDHDGKTGQTVSVKADSCTGIGIDMTTTSGSNSKGMLGQLQSGATVIKLVQTSAATGSLLELHNDYGGTAKLLKWFGSGMNGEIQSDGVFKLTQGSSAPDGLGDNRLQLTAGATISENRYHWAGSGSQPELYFYSSIQSYANRMYLAQAPAAAVGSHTVKKLIEMMDGNMIGFFGVTPVTRRPAIADAIDSTDVVAKFNTLLGGLRAYGLWN